MGATWNRDVHVSQGNEGPVLTFKVTHGDGNPPGRTDGPTRITVKTKDRTGGGARIVYHAKDGLQLTGMTLDGGTEPDGLTAEVRGNGNTLVLTDTGGPGATYDFSVHGWYQGAGINSPDPEIHNEDDDGKEAY